MAGSHLFRRGGIYWWRRRIPVGLRASRDCDRAVNAPLRTGPIGLPPDARKIRLPTHLTLSLRTSCPREARRRAARVTALCDDVWSLMMSMTSPADPVPHPLQLAGGLLSFLGKGVDAYQATLARHPADPVARARDETRAETALKAEMLNSVAGAAARAPDGAERPPAFETNPPPADLLFLKTEIEVPGARNAALADHRRSLDRQAESLEASRARGTDLVHALGHIEGRANATPRERIAALNAKLEAPAAAETAHRPAPNPSSWDAVSATVSAPAAETVAAAGSGAAPVRPADDDPAPALEPAPACGPPAAPDPSIVEPVRQVQTADDLSPMPDARAEQSAAVAGGASSAERPDENPVPCM
jgi:hypothetical protein